MSEKINEIVKELSQFLVLEMREDLMTVLKPLLTKDKEIKECSVKIASIHYGVHSNTIRNWIKSGELASKRIGGKIYVTIKNK